MKPTTYREAQVCCKKLVEREREREWVSEVMIDRYVPLLSIAAVIVIVVIVLS